jgi:hypothetical protein
MNYFTCFYLFFIIIFNFCFSIDASETENWKIVLGSYKNLENAQLMVKYLGDSELYETSIYKRRNYYSVLIEENFSNQTSAKKFQEKLKPLTNGEDFLINMRKDCPQPISSTEYFNCTRKKFLYTDISVALEQNNSVFKLLITKPEDLRHLSNFPNLRELKLKGQSIKELPASLRYNQKLLSVTFENTNIDSFPSILFSLPNLKKIQIVSSKNQKGKVRTIPSAVKKLKLLSYLSLVNQSLTDIPEELTHLTHLKYLNIEGNDLSLLAISKLGYIRYLEYLNIDDNFLSELPSSFSHLTMLKSISACNNSLHESTKVIHNFPTVLCKLKTLERVYLCGNSIPVIPSCINNLQRLKKLDLSDSGTYSVSEQVFSVSSLESINISNSPEKVPLQELKLSDNFCKLQNLKKLNIQGQTYSDTESEKIQDCIPGLVIE